jgi:hypothetical protein
MWKGISHEFFGDGLPPALVMPGKLGRDVCGTTYLPVPGNPVDQAIVVINEKLAFDPVTLRETLLHEACHVATGEGHDGENFQAACVRVGLGKEHYEPEAES